MSAADDGGTVDSARRGVPNRLSRRGFLRGAGGGALAIAAGSVAFGAAGCTTVSLAEEKHGGTLLDRLRDSGRVRMGFANEQPYAFINSDGDLTGEAAEVGKEIFRRLGVDRFSPKLTAFSSLIPALRAGLFDVIAAGMFITPARCAAVLFSDPDYNATEAFLVRRGNPKNVHTLEDVATGDIRLGVLLGAVESDYAADAGVPGGRIVAFSDQSSAFDGVLAGRADAVLLTSPSLRYGLDRRKGLPLEVTEPFIPVVKGEKQFGAGGFGFLPDQTNAVTAFNAELSKLKQEGRLLEIVRPFGFTEAEMTDLTAQRLCSATAT